MSIPFLEKLKLNFENYCIFQFLLSSGFLVKFHSFFFETFRQFIPWVQHFSNSIVYWNIFGSPFMSCECSFHSFSPFELLSGSKYVSSLRQICFLWFVQLFRTLFW